MLFRSSQVGAKFKVDNLNDSATEFVVTDTKAGTGVTLSGAKAITQTEGLCASRLRFGPPVKGGCQRRKPLTGGGDRNKYLLVQLVVNRLRPALHGNRAAFGNFQHLKIRQRVDQRGVLLRRSKAGNCQGLPANINHPRAENIRDLDDLLGSLNGTVQEISHYNIQKAEKGHDKQCSG